MADMNNNQNDFFSAEETAPAAVPESQQTLHVPSLVLGILGTLSGLVIPIVGLVLGIIGTVNANKNKAVAKTTPGLVCSIIAIIVSVIRWIINIVIVMPQLQEQIANLG